MKQLRWSAWLLVAALAVMSCTSASQVQPEEAQLATSEEVPEPDDADSESASSGGASPLIEFLGYETSGAASTAEFENLVNEQVASCMRLEGFDYFAAPPAVEQESEREVLAKLAESREWVEEWGFGVSTQAFSYVEVGPELKGYENRVDDGQSVDANQEYFITLTPPEQQAYQDALVGPDGCVPEAYEMAAESMENDGLVEEFGNELEELEERMLADPRVVDYEKNLGKCVQEQGYEFSGFEAATEQFSIEISAVAEAAYSSPGDETGTESESEPVPELQELPPAQLVALADIQSREIEMALAVYDCGGSWEEFRQVQDEVYYELERQFVENNRTRLEDFKVDD